MSAPRPHPARLPILVTVVMLGFASGVPYNLVGSSLQAWMHDAQVDLKTIGFFSLAGLPYALKFLWSPLLDRYRPPFLGRRRGWILVTFLAVMGSLVLIARSDPGNNLHRVAFLAVLLTFFAASVTSTWTPTAPNCSRRRCSGPEWPCT